MWPKLTMTTATVTSGFTIETFTYINQTGTPYAVIVESTTGSDYDTIKYAAAGSTFTTLRSDLTKGKRYTFTNYNGRCYVANGADALWWFDSTFGAATWDPAKHTVKNAPICQYILAGKGRLFAADLTDYYRPDASFVTTNADADASDGYRELTVDGGTTFLTDLLPGDEIAFGIGSANSASTGATVVNGDATITIKGTDLRTIVAAGDQIAFGRDRYSKWYTITGSISFSTDSTFEVTEVYKDASMTAAATAGEYMIIGGNGTGSGGNYTSTWLKIDKVNSDTQLYVRTTLTYANAAQKYILRRNSKNVLAWSAFEATNDWDDEGIETGESSGFEPAEENITGLAKFSDAVIAFSENGSWCLSGITSGNWRLGRKTNSAIGCSSHWSIVVKDNWMGFYSAKTDSYYFMKGSTLIDQSSVYNLSSLYAQSISEIIRPNLEAIDDDLYQDVRAYVYKDLLLISTPNSETHIKTYTTGTATFTNASTAVTGTSTAWRGTVRAGDKIMANSNGTYYIVSSVNSDTSITLTSAYLGTTSAAAEAYTILKRRCNDIIILDTQTNLKLDKFAWTRLEGLYINGWMNLSNTIYYGSSIDGLIYKFLYGNLLYAANINAEATTGWIDVDYPDEYKMLDALVLKAKSDETITVTWYTDGATTQTGSVSYTFTDAEQPKTVTFPNYESTDEYFSFYGKRIKLKFSVSGSGSTSIYGFALFGNVLPMNNY